MTVPGSDFIPAAFLLPDWLVSAAVAVIEAACTAWDDEEEQ